MHKALSGGIRALALGSAILATSATGVALAAAERSPGGKTLVVPSEDARKGTVYYVHPGKDAQVTFTSDAPLEHIKGTSNDLVGYAVWGGPSDGLVAGEFHLPVKSMETGIPLRDEHMAGSNWLNAADHPNIIFDLERSRNVSIERETDQFTTYTMTLVGSMTIKGETRRLEVPAKITMMPESDRTRSRFPGDLMAIRANYSVELSSYGVSHQTVGQKVAETIELENVLFCSTVSPDN
jgi:polyisoprenoid-binding protein YceI